MKPARCFTPIKSTLVAVLAFLPSPPFVLQVPGTPAQAIKKKLKPTCVTPYELVQQQREKKLRAEHEKKNKQYLAKYEARSPSFRVGGDSNRVYGNVAAAKVNNHGFS